MLPIIHAVFFPLRNGAGQNTALIRKILLGWLPAIAWTLFLFKLSGPQYGFHQSDGILQTIFKFLHLHLEQVSVDMVNGLIRKTAHVVVYAILSLLWFRVMHGVHEKQEWKITWAITCIAICLFVACGDEYRQSMTLGRGGSPLDVLLDVIGGSYMQWIIYRVYTSLRTGS